MRWKNGTSISDDSHANCLRSLFLFGFASKEIEKLRPEIDLQVIGEQFPDLAPKGFAAQTVDVEIQGTVR